MKRRSFTFIELLIVLVIIGVLATISILSYLRYVEKARSTEAIINAGAIRKAEELHKLEKGQYVAAENIEQINESLYLGIQPKYYEYSVVGVSDDNFIVIAKRIGQNIEDYINSGKLPPQPIVIAMDKSGLISSGYGGYPGGTGTGTGGGIGGGTGGGGIGGGGIGGGGTGGGTGGGGGIGGGGGGGTGGGVATVTKAPVYDSDLLNSLNKLKSSSAGIYYYNLIKDEQISVIYAVAPMANVAAWWQGIGNNTIYVNEVLRTKSPESALTAIICHEATHADYSYNPQKWINLTLQRHPELTENDLHIETSPWDSIDQEYNCFTNQMLTWKELKGSDTDSNNDGWEVVYDQGEAYMKNQIKLQPVYQSLPEY